MSTLRRVAVLLAVGCSSNNGSPQDSADDDGADTNPPVETGGDDAPATTSASDPTTPADSSDDADVDGGPTADPPISFDVGGVEEPPGVCAKQADGSYCDSDRTAYTCDAGVKVSETACNPSYCLDGACVECLTGMAACQGAKVMQCNDANNTWDEVEECDAAAGEGCDLGLVACVDLAPVGGTVPTGTYYKYADFHQGAVYQAGCDVDSFDNRIYVSGGGGFESWVSHIDVYEVELLDSDGDGEAERNQHPDNPDDPGPIEERVLTHIEEIPLQGQVMYLQASEIYAFEDRLIFSGEELIEIDLDSHEQTVITTSPTWATGAISGWPYSVSFLGWDDVNHEWFAGNEADRRVFRYHPEADSWGLAFRYPFLAGGHMDGIETITDPSTGIAYTYVSDMTSDFIAQYREDPEDGWVQENLFSYVDAGAADVEGLGFGAFGHFWVSSLAGTLYEIGGGELTEYLPDPDPAG